MPDNPDSITTYKLGEYESHSGIYQYIKIEVRAVDPTKLRALPYQVCPVCGEEGQAIYRTPEHMFTFYCPFCYTHYYVNYIDKGVLKKRGF